MIRYDIAVLGCGWSGILVSYFLLKRYPGLKIVCVDKDSELGGLMKSRFIDGFTFDIGGSHVIFSKSPGILHEMLSFLNRGFVEHRRQAFIYIENRFVPYPFENGLWVFPPEKRAEILISFIEALLSTQCKGDSWRPRSLREWIRGFFGKEIARIYLEPYNEKMWKRNLDEIDTSWIHIPGRLPIPDWRDVVYACVGIPTTGYREQSRFYYPLIGGIARLYRAILHRALSLGLRLIKNMRINNLKKRGSSWIINDYVEAKKLISSIPLREVIELIDAPEYIVKLRRYLDYNRVIVVGVALKKRSAGIHWVYVPDKSIVFHRYAWISSYSPFNAPQNMSSLIVEITMKPNDVVEPETIKTRVIHDLKRLGIISENENEILFTKLWINEYGYPVYIRGHDRARNEIIEYLRSLGIECIGRWGQWHYWNMDRILVEVKRFIENDFQRPS